MSNQFINSQLVKKSERMKIIRVNNKKTLYYKRREIEKGKLKFIIQINLEILYTGTLEG